MDVNIILDRLPNTVEIGGKDYQIYSDFRTSILFETMIRSDLSSHEKLSRMLSLYYPVIPENRSEAIDKALWFYNCGKYEKEKEEEQKNRTGNAYRKNRVAYSFEQDAAYIYAAFQSEYHMNLQRMKSQDLHWWEFQALFEALDDRHKIKQIMYWRTCSTNGLPRKEVQRINELRKRFSLRDDVSCSEKVKLEKRNQRMKDYVQKRFEEVSARGESQHRN